MTVRWDWTHIDPGVKPEELVQMLNVRMPRLQRTVAGLENIFVGSGVPANALGTNGSYYFRTDGSAGAYIYFRAAGVWGAIL